MDFDFLLEIKTVSVREGAKDGIKAFNCESGALYDVVRVLREEYLFDALADVFAIDMGEDAERRYGCVYHFYSNVRKYYARIVCMCDNNSEPKLPSLTPFFANANWHEREAFDMMGIVFKGHPNLKRILMWDEYPWYPLRKDFPLAGKDAPSPETYGGDVPMSVEAAPMEGGPFFSKSGTQDSSEAEARSQERL